MTIRCRATSPYIPLLAWGVDRMENGLEWTILEYLNEHNWATAGSIAGGIDRQTDVVESRLERLRQRGFVDFYCATGRIKWGLTIDGKECVATDAMDGDS